MAAATKEAVGMDKAGLKKTLVIARQQPVNAAFAIGADGKAVILLDKIKKGPALDKELKNSAPDAKSHRFGTVSADEDDPKLARFVVNKAGGGLARKLVVALKGTGFSKVEIVLEDGSAVESGQGEEEDEDGVAATAADGAADVETSPAPDGAGAGEAPRIDPDGGTGATAAAQPDAASLTRDLTGLVQQMMTAVAADPTKKAALVQLATDAQASLKRGDLAEASAGIEIFRQALGGGAAPSASADADDTAPDDDQDDAAGDNTDTADATDSVDGVAAADADDTDDTADDTGKVASPDAATLTKSLTDLVKQMLPIIAADPTQQDALKGIAQQAQASLKGGDLATASGHIDTLQQMISMGTSAAPASSASPGAAAAAAPAIAKARMAWVATRQKVETDLGGLHNTFSSAFKGHPMEGDITKAFRSRVDTVLTKLDSSLADTLDNLNNATDPDQRAKLVQDAHDLIKGFTDHVASDPTIAALDSNPFVPLSIQKTMTATLGALSKAIR